jgi:HD-GYP domain-containing protein (c-di-GMP phosphodiesterase class II)
VEAMASDRPYRRAMDTRAILEEVQSQAGVQFDPDVVAAFSNAVSKSATPVIVNSARSAETPLTAAAAAAVRPEKPVQFNRNTTPV